LSRKGLGTDLAWGAKRGALLGVVFCAVLGAAVLIRGRAVYGDRSLLWLAVVTISFGLLGGLSVGLARPFTQHYWGALIMGFLGGALTTAFCFALVFGIADLREMEPRFTIALVVGSIIVGLRTAGMMRRNQTNRPVA
jgi:hypothetical protein